MLKLVCVLTNILLSVAAATASEKATSFVREGRPEAVRYLGDPWSQAKDGIEAGGKGRLAIASLAFGAGDVTMKARLRIDGLTKSAAAFFLGDSHFGFNGGEATMFVEGPLFGVLKFVGEPLAKDGKVFDFEVRRRGNRCSFWIDGQSVYEAEVSGALGPFGFRPYRSKNMRIFEWSAKGSLVEPKLTEERRPEFMIDLFQSGPGLVPNYRIPVLLRTKKGTLLAFAEARRRGEGDAGDIDMILKRSTDGGRSWGPEELVWDDGDNTCGNPCPVVDQTNGRVWLAMTWNRGSDHEWDVIAGKSEDFRRNYITYSDDDGRTWAEPKDISKSVRKPNWGWYATGPGNAIQLTRGKHAGRLVIPANHSDPTEHNELPGYLGREYRSHVVYSDDHGVSWKLGGVLDWGTNESTVVELSDGSILDNMRSYFEKNRRAVSVSRDGGESWSPVRHHPELVEPRCQANMIRYSFPSATEKSRILFCNPANPTSRKELTVRVSYDEGKTWPVSAMLYRGYAAYSCMAVIDDGTIGLYFERDHTSKLSFMKFTMEWLEKPGK